MFLGENVARDFARAFYRSKAWKQTREAYANSRSGLCERCLERGIITPGAIVHHKEHLSPDNIDDPTVSLSFENLELVCRNCHAAEHPEIYGSKDEGLGRVGFDEDGNLIDLEGR